MSEIELFENPSFGSLRVVMRENNPWFVTADVCRCLGTISWKYLDEVISEREKAPVDVISESGLYRLIMHSRLPAADAFMDWVIEIGEKVRRIS